MPRALCALCVSALAGALVLGAPALAGMIAGPGMLALSLLAADRRRALALAAAGVILLGAGLVAARSDDDPAPVRLEPAPAAAPDRQSF